MKRVVLVTGHYLQSKRRAGFHWLADAYWRGGDEVIFVTAAISWLSWLRRNYRMAYDIRGEANRLRWVRPRLGSYVWFTPWHPADFRCGPVNRLTVHWFSRYPRLPLGRLADLAAAADLIVYESTPGVMLFDRFRGLNPAARHVYRASDDMRTLQIHPVVRDAELRMAPHFDRLSVPSEYILRRFGHLPRAALDHHAVRKEVFDRDGPNPYPPESKTNAVFVGMSRFDRGFLAAAARLMPDWNFHVIGDIRRLPAAPNIIAHGTKPFDETVPYIQHADVGLHCLEDAPGVEAFTDSLKVIQYTHCRLPIVAPECLRSSRANKFYYRPGDDASIRRALLAARSADRTQIANDQVRSWDELAATLAGDTASRAARELV